MEKIERSAYNKPRTYVDTPKGLIDISPPDPQPKNNIFYELSHTNNPLNPRPLKKTS